MVWAGILPAFALLKHDLAAEDSETQRRQDAKIAPVLGPLCVFATLRCLPLFQSNCTQPDRQLV